jgi:tRNA1Val (adenine37-N6)-methyltransferase
VSKNFEFKYFTVNQERSALKVGTDSMLLGALLDADTPKRCLDLGAGSGVLSLMTCQQYPNISVDAIEIDLPSHQDCKENFGNSAWSENLNAILGDYLAYSFMGSYDLIVSNPPFYFEYSDKINKVNSRTKHISKALFIEFFTCAQRLLSGEGRFWLILPYGHLDLITKCAEQYGLYIYSMTTIHAKPSKPNSRIVICLSKKETTPRKQALTVRNDDNTYTKRYINLTKEFHGKQL